MAWYSRCLFFLLAFSSIFADWDPEYCLPDDDISVLTDPSYIRMKEQMQSYLKGTWCSAAKAELLMDLVCVTRPDLCVEIGAHTGSSVLPVAKVLSYLDNGIIVAIDAWSNSVATRYMDYDDPNRAWWGTVNLEDCYQKFLVSLTQHWIQDYCDVIRSTSEEAAAMFDDDIDFLHLDGDYTEKGSLQDVRLYLPKVKKGGYILLSNLFVMVKGKAPKMKAFSELFDACEMICEIDRDNVVLFRKN